MHRGWLHRRTPLKTRTARQAQPATFVAFDLLHEEFVPLLDRPLQERRERLERFLRSWSHPRLVFSQGIVGQGRQLFAETCRQNLEGIMAKRLASPYRAGKRGADWLKCPLPRSGRILRRMLPNSHPKRG